MLFRSSWKFFLLTGFGLVLGSMIRPTHQAEKRKIIFVLLAITALIEIFQFIITRVISDLSAERVYLPVTMFLICFFIMISWLFFFPRLYLITFALLFCYLGCVSIVQFHFIENYSIAYDKRMEVIRKDKDTSVVVFEPLPSSGLLLSAEISADTNAFPNQHLRMAYHRKFPVLVRSE